MSKLAVQWATPARLAALPLAALVAVLAARGPLGIQADPLKVVAAFLAGMLALVLVARYPAAFIAPVLFIPRDKELSSLSGLGEAGSWTALQVAGSLLCAGVAIRWIQLEFRPPSSPVAEAATEFAASPTSNPGRILKAFLLFACALSVSYLYTAAPGYGGEKLVGFLTLSGGLFFAASVLLRGERDYRDFAIGTAIFAMAVAASSLSFSATGASAAEDNPAHIGKGQVIGLGIAMLLYSRIANRWLRALVLLICIPWLSLGLVSAETRGPLFSLALVLGLSLFIKNLRSPLVSRKQMAIVAMLLAGVVMLLSAFWFYGNEASRFSYKADEIVALIQGSEEARGTAVQRLVFYRAAFNGWRQRPVFGWGIGGWSIFYWHSDYRAYPHNLFLEVLVEQGLAGIAFLLFFLAAVSKELWAGTARLAGSVRCFLPAWIYLLSIAMFSGDLDDDRFLWFWCGLTWAACALARRARSESYAFDREARSYGTSPIAGQIPSGS